MIPAAPHGRVVALGGFGLAVLLATDSGWADRAAMGGVLAIAVLLLVKSRRETASVEARLGAAKKALAVNVHRFEFLSRATIEGFWELDSASGTEYVSDHWKQILGYEGDAAAPMTDLGSLVHPADRDAFLADLAAFYASSSPVASPPFARLIRIRRVDGEYIPVLYRAGICRRDDGTPLYLDGTLLDLSSVVPGAPVTSLAPVPAPLPAAVVAAEAAPKFVAAPAVNRPTVARAASLSPIVVEPLPVGLIEPAAGRAAATAPSEAAVFPAVV